MHRRILFALFLLPGSSFALDPSLQPFDVGLYQASFERRLERMSEARLKDSYVRCSDAAIAGNIRTGEIAACSLVYELLLRRVFRGDFDALLAWSRPVHPKPARLADPNAIARDDP